MAHLVSCYTFGSIQNTGIGCQYLKNGFLLLFETKSHSVALAGLEVYCLCPQLLGFQVSTPHLPLLGSTANFGPVVRDILPHPL